MVYNKTVLNELDVSNKVVFLRLDLNVPVIDGKITSFKRINATLPTIKFLLDNNAKVVILSHFGRPKSMKDLESGNFSLEIVARALADKVGNLASSFTFISENKGVEVEEAIKKLQPKGILFLENTRFNDFTSNDKEINLESECNEALAQYWAGLCDIFVNDAYGAAHRKHASTYGIAKYQRNNAIGFLMNEELKQLTSIVENPIRPLCVIFGGAKVSDKSKAVEATLEFADKVIISGGMAYTFLAAQGFDMGKSRVEKDFLPEAKRLLQKYYNKIVVSSDFLCSPDFSDTEPVYRTKEQGLGDYMGLDIGEKSIQQFEEVINSCNSIMWNGPMGVTEFSHYTIGTNKICDAIARRTDLGAFTVIGGGDSAAAAEKLGKENSFSWISTGGGASLTLVEGKELLGIKSITESLKKKVVIHRKRTIYQYIDLSAEIDVKSVSSFNRPNAVFTTDEPLTFENIKVVNMPWEDFITEDMVYIPKDEQLEFNSIDDILAHTSSGVKKVRILEFSLDKGVEKVVQIKQKNINEVSLGDLDILKGRKISSAALRLKDRIKKQKNELESVSSDNE